MISSPASSKLCPRIRALHIVTLSTLVVLSSSWATLPLPSTALRLLSSNNKWHPPSTSSHVSSAWHQQRPRPESKLHSGRDVMEVKGLPKANIMRTNSTSAYAFDFDLSQQVLTQFEEELRMEEQQRAQAVAVPFPSSDVAATSASVISAAALIAGCMVGAGVLALPSVTLESGVMPSTMAIGTVWTYCVAGALLIAEVCINSRGKAAAASYLKIAGATVGKEMATVAFTLFTVFQYFLLVAYISQGGCLLNNFLGQMHLEGLHLDGALAPGIFTLGMGSMLTLGNKRILENFNNTVVMVVLGTFLALLVGGMQKVDPSLWAHHDVSKLHDVVPVAMCALVFQNVIPLISSSLQFDRKKILSAILLGSGCPMVMYLAWNAMVIGNVPLDSIGAHGFDLPGLFHGAPEFSALLAVFSLAAIATSFLGCTLSVIEEISEFLRGNNPNQHIDLKEPSPLEKLPLYSLVLVPPLLASVVYPEGFLTAIETSGGFGDPFLFGLLPVVMAWKQRYGTPAAAATQAGEGLSTEAGAEREKAEPLLPGGKASLVAVAAITVAMFINKSSESLPFMCELLQHKSVAAAAAEVMTSTS